MRNLHKLFYKDYFEHNVEIEEKDRNTGNVKKYKKKISYKFLTDTNDAKKIQELNSKILNHKDGVNHLLTKKAELKVIQNECCNAGDSFTLKTLYPGLITGVGIDHEAGIVGEFKLGVHFDYTYGMPIIYGSSVKGVLKTYFKDFAKDYNNTLTNDELIYLEKDIFDGKKMDDNKSIYDRDIFFDAVISSPNRKGKILDSDSLCPHGENPLKNPIPISFLKIASDVTIEFRFKLVDSKVGNIELKKLEKKTIFETILKTVGIGAKTNVGYGQFSQA